MSLMFPVVDLDVAALACLVCLIVGVGIGHAFPLRRAARADA